MSNLLYWFSRWRAQRRKARYLKWVKENHVTFAKPLSDSRNWSDTYMRSLKDGRRF